jgi:hypothetical protein
MGGGMVLRSGFLLLQLSESTIFIPWNLLLHCRMATEHDAALGMTRLSAMGCMG